MPSTRAVSSVFEVGFLAWNAQDYVKHSTVQQQWAMDLFSKLALQGDAHLVDIGCGGSKITAKLSVKFDRGSVIRIDSAMARVTHDDSNLSTHVRAGSKRDLAG